MNRLPAAAEDLHSLARLVTGRLPWRDLPEGRLGPTVTLAVRHGLGPLLWDVLEAQGGFDGDVLGPGRAAVMNAARISRFQFQLLAETHAEVLASFNGQGIPSLWIKGFDLARSVYRAPHLRPMDDLDVLVPFAQREAALRAVEGLRYQLRFPDALAEKFPIPDHLAHHYHLAGGPSGSVIFELHFRLPGGSGLPPLSEEQTAWFWEQSGSFTDDLGSYSHLKPEAHLLYLCAHAILQHGESNFRLQRYLDIHLIAEKYPLNWDLLISQAAALRWTYAVERALLLTQEYFATRIPAHLLQDLREHRLPVEDTRRAARLAGSAVRLESTRLDLSHYPLHERLKRIWSLMLPPAGYMRQRYGVPPGMPLYRVYLHRWKDLLEEAARSIFKSQ